jgi:hypothetical protein
LLAGLTPAADEGIVIQAELVEKKHQLGFNLKSGRINIYPAARRLFYGEDNFFRPPFSQHSPHFTSFVLSLSLACAPNTF